jgi:hypothetical protein
MSNDKVVLHVVDNSEKHTTDESIRNDNRLESCCFTNSTDKRLYVLIVQTIISIGLIIFCSVMLSDPEINCERGNTFVSLLSLVFGYWLKSPLS